MWHSELVAEFCGTWRDTELRYIGWHRKLCYATQNREHGARCFVTWRDTDSCVTWRDIDNIIPGAAFCNVTLRTCCSALCYVTWHSEHGVHCCVTWRDKDNYVTTLHGGYGAWCITRRDREITVPHVWTGYIESCVTWCYIVLHYAMWHRKLRYMILNKEHGAQCSIKSGDVCSGLG